MLSLLLAFSLFAADAPVGSTWAPHSMDRPRPPVVQPAGPAAMPSDAHALLGADLSNWRSDPEKGAKETLPAKWLYADGVLTLELPKKAGTPKLEAKPIAIH